MQLKQGYFLEKVHNKFFTLPGFYLMYLPIIVPYDRLEKESEKFSLEPDEKFDGLIEKATGFGWGWIGMAVKGQSGVSEQIKEVIANFVGYEYVGKYSEMGKIYKKIMADYPTATDFYNVYLTKPGEVKPEQSITHILFRVDS
ncbi:MAG: hypothetical protein OHK0017_11930 [Patescibacteria group bacterium]